MRERSPPPPTVGCFLQFAFKAPRSLLSKKAKGHVPSAQQKGPGEAVCMVLWDTLLSDVHLILIFPHKKQCKCKPYTVDLRGWKRSAEALNQDSRFLPGAFPAGGHTAAIRSLSTSAPQHICKSSFCLFPSYDKRVSCVVLKVKLFRIMLSSSDAIQCRVTFLVRIGYLTLKHFLGAWGLARSPAPSCMPGWLQCHQQPLNDISPPPTPVVLAPYLLCAAQMGTHSSVILWIPQDISPLDVLGSWGTR